MTECNPDDFYPDEFVITYEVNASDYLLNLKWENNHLSFKQFSPELEIQELINPNSDEWDEFWHRMDELEIWGWYELYQVKCSDSCLAGDIWEVIIKRGDKIVESQGSNSYPSTFLEFVRSVEELTGILIDFIQED